MNDSSFFKYETTFSKNGDDPRVLDFTVTLREHSYSDDYKAAAPVALLEGFMAQPGYLPDPYDRWYFGIFDMRSAHSMDAFSVLADDQGLLSAALQKKKASLDDCDAVAHLERAWVDPSLRGRGIALRLMREAQHVLGRYGLLVILKAHPDGEDIADAQCRKLAKYYQSDKGLGLVPVSSAKRPGWLVAIWDEPRVHSGDTVYLPD